MAPFSKAVGQVEHTLIYWFLGVRVVVQWQCHHLQIRLTKYGWVVSPYHPTGTFTRQEMLSLA